MCVPWRDYRFLSGLVGIVQSILYRECNSTVKTNLDNFEARSPIVRCVAALKARESNWRRGDVELAAERPASQRALIGGGYG